MKIYCIKHKDLEEYLTTSKYELKWSPDKPRVWSRRGDVTLFLLRYEKDRVSGYRTSKESLKEHLVMEMTMVTKDQWSCKAFTEEARKKRDIREQKRVAYAQKCQSDREIQDLKKLQAKYPGVK